MSFWDFLKPPAPTKAKGSPKPPTAAELEAALSEAEAAAQAAEAAAAAVAQERADKLLTADDTVLDEVERRLQLAVREADRAAAAVDALRGRVAQAQEAERQAGRDAVYNKGAALLRSGVELYRRYDEVARQLAGLVERIADTDDAIRAINHELLALGDPRALPELEREARPPSGAESAMALWLQAEIPSGVEPGAFHWRLGASRTEDLPAIPFHQPPHAPGPFRSIRPEAEQ